MKLKGLKNRAYHILFHTHTVSGIVISFGLFVIFYAGAFSLFRHEIYRWENPEARMEVYTGAIDFDQALTEVKAAYPNFAEQEQFTFRLPNEEMPFLKFYGAENVPDEERPKRFSAQISPVDYTVTNLEKAKTTVGETLYHLHYFRQIPAGLYISGLVALFFLFATVTGVLIHWRNILTKFYAFRTDVSWKQIWTNAHTVLGVIGLPFQVIYAVTGALFGLLTLLLIPSALVLYGGDTDKILAAVNPAAVHKPNKEAPLSTNLSINELYEIAGEKLGNKSDIFHFNFQNFGRADAIANYRTDDKIGLMGDGTLTLKMKTGEVLAQTLPYQKTYTESVLNLITKLHFGTFGGIALKVVYFILAMLTCFMLISGVLLWQVARDNKKYTPEQRLFQHRVTKIYLAICLGLFPATALIFIANKLVPWVLDSRALWVNTVFFAGWFLFIGLGILWDNYAKINKNYLILGGLLSLLIPASNGLMTGDWLWTTWQNGDWYVWSVDIFWLLTGVMALAIAAILQTKKPNPILRKASKKQKSKDTPILAKEELLILQKKQA
ncbi:MAG: PepSY-associated TM helix domain-containing protein [Bacteroidota bacterium]